MVQDATLLSPHTPTWFSMAFFSDHYFNERYEEALAEALLLDWAGDFRIPLYVAASYGQLGRLDQAASALEELLSLWPRPITELRAELIERHALAPELADRLIEGLAKAGLEGL
jgi:cytochrome c-type biogenesis protein CcmH/NrfG